MRVWSQPRGLRQQIRFTAETLQRPPARRRREGGRCDTFPRSDADALEELNVNDVSAMVAYTNPKRREQSKRCKTIEPKK